VKLGEGGRRERIQLMTKLGPDSSRGEVFSSKLLNGKFFRYKGRQAIQKNWGKGGGGDTLTSSESAFLGTDKFSGFLLNAKWASR